MLGQKQREWATGIPRIARGEAIPGRSARSRYAADAEIGRVHPLTQFQWNCKSGPVEAFAREHYA